MLIILSMLINVHYNHHPIGYEAHSHYRNTQQAHNVIQKNYNSDWSLLILHCYQEYIHSCYYKRTRLDNVS